MWSAVLFITAVFTIPAAFFASLTSLDRIAKIFPFVQKIADASPAIRVNTTVAMNFSLSGLAQPSDKAVHATSLMTR